MTRTAHPLPDRDARVGAGAWRLYTGALFRQQGAIAPSARPSSRRPAARRGARGARPDLDPVTGEVAELEPWNARCQARQVARNPSEAEWEAAHPAEPGPVVRARLHAKGGPQRLSKSRRSSARRLAGCASCRRPAARLAARATGNPHTLDEFRRATGARAARYARPLHRRGRCMTQEQVAHRHRWRARHTPEELRASSSPSRPAGRRRLPSILRQRALDVAHLTTLASSRSNGLRDRLAARTGRRTAPLARAGPG